MPAALCNWTLISDYDCGDTIYHPDKFPLTSEYISTNVLPIDEE